MTDWTGRVVEYQYEPMLARAPIPLALQELYGLETPYIPGLFLTQARLEKVRRTAPATADAPARVSEWTYRWLSQDEILDALGAPPQFDVPGGEICGPAQQSLQARLDWELRFDHLAGNLVTIKDPFARHVLHSIYETDPTHPEFDRVIAQRFGSSPALTLFQYSTDLTQLPGEMVTAANGLGLVVGSSDCSAASARHVAAPFDPTPMPPFMSSIPSPHPRPVDPIQLAVDLQTICQLTRYIDRNNEESWIATNFAGHALVVGQRVDGRILATAMRYDLHGHKTVERSPLGRRTSWIYDQMSPSPFSRDNLIYTIEQATDPATGVVTTRQAERRYDPIFGQVLRERDTRGEDRWHLLDYQELSNGDAMLALLRAYGADVTSISTLSPDLLFYGVDINGDGSIGPVRGNTVVDYGPWTHTASNAFQLPWTIYRHNVFGQVVQIERAGTTPVTLTYRPATLEEVPDWTTHDFFGVMLPGQRTARSSSGGYLIEVTQLERQRHPHLRAQGALRQPRAAVLVPDHE